MKKSEGLQAIEKPLASLPHAIGKHILEHIPVIGIIRAVTLHSDSFTPDTGIPLRGISKRIYGGFHAGHGAEVYCG